MKNPDTESIIYRLNQLEDVEYEANDDGTVEVSHGDYSEDFTLHQILRAVESAYGEKQASLLVVGPEQEAR